MPQSWSEIPVRQWQRLALARHRLLLLDYDGTLSPLQTARERAGIPPHAIGLVRRIAEDTAARVTIISGRPVHDLQRLIPSLPLGMVGEHGWEELAEDRTLLRHALPDGVEARLDSAARTLYAHAPGADLERKRSSVALHTRALGAHDAHEAEAMTALARELWWPLTEGVPLELRGFHSGLELRASGRDKGVAVTSLMERAPAGTFATYLGDDDTDEDAFAVLRDIGFPVRVGKPTGPTSASGWIPGPLAVAEFLEEWLRVVRGAPRAL